MHATRCRRWRCRRSRRRCTLHPIDAAPLRKFARTPHNLIRTYLLASLSYTAIANSPSFWPTFYIELVRMADTYAYVKKAIYKIYVVTRVRAQPPAIMRSNCAFLSPPSSHYIRIIRHVADFLMRPRGQYEDNSESILVEGEYNEREKISFCFLCKIPTNVLVI